MVIVDGGFYLSIPGAYNLLFSIFAYLAATYLTTKRLWRGYQGKKISPTYVVASGWIYVSRNKICPVCKYFKIYLKKQSNMT